MTYLPRHPEINCLGPADQSLASHYRTSNIYAAMLAVVFSCLFLWVEFSLRRELSLARIGETAEGQIIGKKCTTGRNRTTYRVRYLFEAPDGTRSGWQTVGSHLWACLSEGAAITVLFDPDHLDRHRPSFGLRFVQFLPETEEE